MGLAPLLGMVFVFLLTLPMFGKLESYFVVYGLRSPAWGVIMGGAGVAGMIAAPLAWMSVLERCSRASVLAGLGLGLLAIMLVFAVAGRQPFVASVCAFALGCLGGGVNLLLWAAMGDTAARAGPRRVGLIHGLFTAVSKTALAIGAGLLGWLLSRMDYRAEGGEDLVQVMAGAPAVGAVACMAAALFWGVAERRARRDILADAT